MPDPVTGGFSRATEAPPARMLDLLRELGDLKRIRSAGHNGSIAERLFASAWSGLCTSRTVDASWRATVAAALAATRLGDIDRGVFAAIGVPAQEAGAILERALDEAVGEMDPTLRTALRGAPGRSPAGSAPRFVTLLARQPRAGVTCPGRSRLLLEPPENHAEHCLMVAVYGVLLCPIYGARPETVYLAALAHHLHNAIIPDSGFAGEVLLGAHLEPGFARATDLALDELPAALADSVRVARAILPDADTPEGRAFHAADTLDRVLQIEQHLRAGKATMHYVLHDMELVHAGPVRSFQDDLLTTMGLAA